MVPGTCLLLTSSIYWYCCMVFNTWCVVYVPGTMLSYMEHILYKVNVGMSVFCWLSTGRRRAQPVSVLILWRDTSSVVTKLRHIFLLARHRNVVKGVDKQCHAILH